VSEDERQYKAFLEPWARRRLGSIKRSEVVRLHAKIGSENGPYAANRVLSLLSAMFNKSREIGWEGKNPCKDIKRFKETPRDRFIQGDELPRFFEALTEEPEPFADFFALSLLLGCRKSNLMAMAWADINLDSAVWRIAPDKAKGGEVILVPLQLQAVEILRRRRELSGESSWVFPSARSKTGHVTEVKASWARILKRAGLTDLRVHDLRRSLASWMAMEGTSLLIVGKALGHRQASTTQLYARLQVDPVRTAMTAAAQAMLKAAKIQQKGLTDGPQEKLPGME